MRYKRHGKTERKAAKKGRETGNRRIIYPTEKCNSDWYARRSAQRGIKMDREEEMRRVAVRVMEAGRNQLFFTYRYLEQALFRLQRKESRKIRIGSDGEYLYYRQDYVLSRYRQDSSELAGDYLHTVIHCLYRHPFFGKRRKRVYWDLAADMAAEYIRMEMTGEEGEEEEDGTACRRTVLEEAEKELRTVSAPGLYAWLERRYESGKDILGKPISELKSLFARDEHDFWYEEEQKQCQQEQHLQEQHSQEQHPQEQHLQEQHPQERHSQEQHLQEQHLQEQHLQEQWKEIAESVLMTLQGFDAGILGQGMLRGERAGRLIRSLQSITRENYDYREFLKKFARLEERLRTNDEEFDYVYYTYGLQIFDRMPLIEPLESKESLLIREFIIAVDTSGSCEGELVERFLTKTCNILKQTENFASKVNIHIIQCDARIQEDRKIESAAELEEYISRLSLKGFGGTDFRPVFEYVEDLREAGELKRTDGLIYFTDGYGIFPAVPPKYRTAFAFVNRDDDVKVPPWAMKVYLDEEGLR